MKSIPLGRDRSTGAEVRIPKDAFRTHFHLIGGTGKGKTTAIHTMLHKLLVDPTEPACWFIVDRLGNLSEELLLWLASPFCPDHVRKRLIYIEPSNEHHVLGFNPLLYETPAHGYYKVARATDIILRAWESVNIEAMPRLARWTFNAFWAAAQLGLTIADCVHFLQPASEYHAPLMRCLPDLLRLEWEELVRSKGAEVVRTLDSTRNRLKPYFESDILRHMFGSTESRLDVLRFMKEGRIILLNLAPQNRLSSQLGDAIGALILNEILATARSLPRMVRYPTYLLLDEFQNFVGPDIESALPEVRQLGIRLILSHQSFSQLERGDHDLTTMIFQAQSRMIFGLQGEDADLMAHELASLNYDPMRVKAEIYSRRQLVTGHRIIELSSRSFSESQARNWSSQYGRNWSTNRSVSHSPGHQSEGEGGSDGGSDGGGEASQTSRGTHQTLVPVYEQFLELASRTYTTFDEQRNEWARDIRRLPTGTTFLRLVNDPTLHAVDVKRSAARYLSWDLERIHRQMPQVIENVQRILEENFQSELFVSPQAIEHETQRRLQAAIQPPIIITTGPGAASPPEMEDKDAPRPYPFG